MADLTASTSTPWSSYSATAPRSNLWKLTSATRVPFGSPYRTVGRPEDWGAIHVSLRASGRGRGAKGLNHRPVGKPARRLGPLRACVAAVQASSEV
jgi:hypothetical protein